MKRLGLIAASALLLAGGAAQAEIFGSDGLLIRFSGGFTPRSLPRDRDVPVRVHLDTHFKTTDGGAPPALRRISFGVNRYGRITTRGLPTCMRSQLEATDERLALARCGGALVGSGHFGARLNFADREPLPAKGRALAFNSRLGRRPAILLHIHASNPIEITIVLVFRVTHPRRGKFGTVLTAKIPRLASDLGYVTDVSLNFKRRYRSRGKSLSFLSARCAAPEGFNGALFSFTRGVFNFAGGKRVVTTLVRNCSVRGVA